MTEDPNDSRESRLKALRSQIDGIDAGILDLINKRLSIGKIIGEIKKETNSEIFDPSREKRVLEKIISANRGPADNQVLRYIFTVIMTATKDVQKTRTVSFLGPEAGYAHIAALNHFKHSGTFVERPNIYEVFKDVSREESHFGVVPVENSIEGAVNHTLDLFSEFDLNICAEYFEPVSHDLLSISGEGDHVEKIYATAQALSRCRGWLKHAFPDTETVEMSTTATAARAASRESRAAAIANRQAAHIYHLHVVESAIEDFSGNITRFLIIGKTFPDKTGDDKTSVMFSTPHSPGSLFKVLEPVNTAGLNMLKLESRPTRHQHWRYFFFMDIEGHIEDTGVAETVEKMANRSLSLKHLGSYPVFRKGEK